MSNVSIYEKKWIDLVFEGKNKKYGAYQLRQENSKTILKALFFGLLFVTSLFGAGTVLSSFGPKPVTVIPLDEPIVPVNLTYKTEPVKPTKPLARKNNETPRREEVPGKNLVNPVIVDTNPDIINTNDQMLTNPDEGSPTGTTTTTTVVTGPPTGPEIPAANPNATYGTGSVDKLPQYPGGIDAFRADVGNKFKTPEMDEARTVRIFVSFVVEKDGTLTDIKVLKNPGFGLDKEAIRVLKSMKTKWEPGMVKGQPVRTSYTLPITVKME